MNTWPVRGLEISTLIKSRFFTRINTEYSDPWLVHQNRNANHDNMRTQVSLWFFSSSLRKLVETVIVESRQLEWFDTLTVSHKHHEIFTSLKHCSALLVAILTCIWPETPCECCSLLSPQIRQLSMMIGLQSAMLSSCPLTVYIAWCSYFHSAHLLM